MLNKFISKLQFINNESKSERSEGSMTQFRVQSDLKAGVAGTCCVPGGGACTQQFVPEEEASICAEMGLEYVSF